jgi:hypothetical protein
MARRTTASANRNPSVVASFIAGGSRRRTASIWSLGMPASSAMSTTSCVQGPQSSARAPTILAAKLASIGTASRWADAFMTGANLKKAAGE